MSAEDVIVPKGDENAEATCYVSETLQSSMPSYEISLERPTPSAEKRNIAADIRKQIVTKDTVEQFQDGSSGSDMTPFEKDGEQVVPNLAPYQGYGIDTKSVSSGRSELTPFETDTKNIAADMSNIAQNMKDIAQNMSVEVEYEAKQSKKEERTEKKTPASPSNSMGSAPFKKGFKDSFEYVAAIKTQFKNEPQVYKEFLSIMRSFHTTEHDVETTVDLVSKLFAGHKHMILGFNNFLPEENKISLDDDDEKNDIPNEITTNSISEKSAGVDSVSIKKPIDTERAAALEEAAEEEDPNPTEEKNPVPEAAIETEEAIEVEEVEVAEELTSTEEASPVTELAATEIKEAIEEEEKSVEADEQEELTPVEEPSPVSEVAVEIEESTEVRETIEAEEVAPVEGPNPVAETAIETEESTEVEEVVEVKEVSPVTEAVAETAAVESTFVEGLTEASEENSEILCGESIEEDVEENTSMERGLVVEETTPVPEHFKEKSSEPLQVEDELFETTLDAAEENVDIADAERAFLAEMEDNISGNVNDEYEPENETQNDITEEVQVESAESNEVHLGFRNDGKAVEINISSKPLGITIAEPTTQFDDKSLATIKAVDKGSPYSCLPLAGQTVLALKADGAEFEEMNDFDLDTLLNDITLDAKARSLLVSTPESGYTIRVSLPSTNIGLRFGNKNSDDSVATVKSVPRDSPFYGKLQRGQSVLYLNVDGVLYERMNDSELDMILTNTDGTDGRWLLVANQGLKVPKDLTAIHNQRRIKGLPTFDFLNAGKYQAVKNSVSMENKPELSESPLEKAAEETAVEEKKSKEEADDAVAERVLELAEKAVAEGVEEASESPAEEAVQEEQVMEDFADAVERTSEIVEEAAAEVVEEASESPSEETVEGKAVEDEHAEEEANDAVEGRGLEIAEDTKEAVEEEIVVEDVAERALELAEEPVVEVVEEASETPAEEAVQESAVEEQVMEDSDDAVAERALELAEDAIADVVEEVSESPVEEEAMQEAMQEEKYDEKANASVNERELTVDAVDEVLAEKPAVEEAVIDSKLYIQEVKKRFAGQPEKYLEFLNIMGTYQEELMKVDTVILEKVEDIFIPDHTDLMDQFYGFVPGSRATA